MTPFEKAKNEAAEKFTEWFAKNYPGPETVIYDPYWHAPRIFSKAIGEMQMVSKSEFDELVNVLELVRSQMCWDRDRDQLSMGLCDLHSSVTEALAKYRAGNLPK